MSEEIKNSKSIVKFMPSPECILIKKVKVEEEKTTGSGLIIPTAVSKRRHDPKSGEVVGFGAEVENIEVGDRVSYMYLAGHKIEGIADTKDDDEYEIIFANEILGKHI